MPERVDEGAVDLERVEREAVEVGERRVAGAEVVEDQLHPHLAERLEGRLGAGRFLDQDALGYLQAQVDGVEPGAGEDVGDRVREVAVGDLAGGEVDRDVERALVGTLLVPLEHLAAGALLDPAPDRLDQAALLGDRDEVGRVELAVAGVVPADQGLERGHLAAREVDHRLVVEDELVAFDPLAQLALGLEPAQRAGPHLGVEELAAGAAAFLRPVHRRVGVADQHVRVGGLAGRGTGDGDPEAGGDEVVGAGDHVGLGEGRRDAIGDRDRLVLVGETVDQDPELVAAEAGDDVPRPQVGPQPRRDRPQQLVAGVVAEAVVDQLEVVEVEEEDSDRRAGDRRPPQRVGQRLDEAGPVRQPRQRVVEDPVPQRLIGDVALDRVGEHVRRRLDEVDVLGREAARLGRVDVEHPERLLLPFDHHGEAAADAEHPQRRRHRVALLAGPVVDDHVQAGVDRGPGVRVARGGDPAAGADHLAFQPGPQVEAAAVAVELPDAGAVDAFGLRQQGDRLGHQRLGVAVLRAPARRASPPSPAGPPPAAAPARRACAR